MTEASSVFRRLGSMGWLALAGSSLSLDQAGVQISERLLEVADLSRVPVLLTPDSAVSPDVQAFLDDLEILLGMQVQTLHPGQLEDEQLRATWLSAGIIIMAGGSQDFWRELIGERLFKIQPQEILADGMVLFAFDASASLMGAWTLNQVLHELDKGLGWVMGSVVLPTNTDPAEIAAIHNHLEEQEGVYALGLPDGTLLALGPDGQVEVWTEKAPILLLGKGWKQS